MTTLKLRFAMNQKDLQVAMNKRSAEGSNRSACIYCG